MRRGLKLFPARLSRGERAVYGGVTVYFLFAFLALMWPIYPRFSRIAPTILGIPFSLAYIVVIILISFLVLLSLYLWESRTGRLD